MLASAPVSRFKVMSPCGVAIVDIQAEGFSSPSIHIGSINKVHSLSDVFNSESSTVNTCLCWVAGVPVKTCLVLHTLQNDSTCDILCTAVHRLSILWDGVFFHTVYMRCDLICVTYASTDSPSCQLNYQNPCCSFNRFSLGRAKLFESFQNFLKFLFIITCLPCKGFVQLSSILTCVR